MAGTAAVYQASAADREAAEIAASASDSVGRQIYKHLMNGVSHMLPFVIGGGILIALAFLSIYSILRILKTSVLVHLYLRS